MDPVRVPFAPSAPAGPSCEACHLGSEDLRNLSRHVEHVAGTLSPIEQRQLRSHLFALLAAMSGTIDLPD